MPKACPYTGRFHKSGCSDMDGSINPGCPTWRCHHSGCSDMEVPSFRCSDMMVSSIRDDDIT
ncbi:MAG: hypothetical protein K2J49_06420 [Muribaculaceae bacterium]|nr:hypothetical protein [Muribaculaceae bacterium]